MDLTGRLAAVQALRADPDPLGAGLQARAAVADLCTPALIASAAPREASQLAWLLVLAGEPDVALRGLAARADQTGEARWLAEAGRLAAR